jgi:hypothetical protein
MMIPNTAQYSRVELPLRDLTHAGDVTCQPMATKRNLQIL